MDAGFQQQTIVQVNTYNGFELLLQLAKQQVTQQQINFTKFEQIVKIGVTNHQVTNDFPKQYVTDQKVNFGSFTREQAITLIKLIGVTNLKPEETHALRDVIKITCKSGHSNWRNPN